MTLNRGSLKDAWAEEARFDLAQLRGVLLVDPRLQGASLQKAELKGASLRYSELQGASLDGANVQGASLLPTMHTSPHISSGGSRRDLMLANMVWMMEDFDKGSTTRSSRAHHLDTGVFGEPTLDKRLRRTRRARAR